MRLVSSRQRPNPWTNQDILLYHGTVNRSALDILDRIDLNKCRPAVDFGLGFYTTTLLRQAEAWAQLKAHQSGEPPAVVEFIVKRDHLATLDGLWFVRGTYDAEDYWSLIFHCRMGMPGHGRGAASLSPYDIVVGPVTGFWRQKAALLDYDQVSFHTNGAIGLLNDGPKRHIS